MSRVRPLSDFFQLLTGPGIWFAHFVVLYGSEAYICTPPVVAPGAMTWVGGAATLTAIAALAAFATCVMRRPGVEPDSRHTGAAFLRGATLLLMLLSAIAVIGVAFPIAVLPVCAPPAG